MSRGQPGSSGSVLRREGQDEVDLSAVVQGGELLHQGVEGRADRRARLPFR